MMSVGVGFGLVAVIGGGIIWWAIRELSNGVKHI